MSVSEPQHESLHETGADRATPRRRWLVFALVAVLVLGGAAWFALRTPSQMAPTGVARALGSTLVIDGYRLEWDALTADPALPATDPPGDGASFAARMKHNGRSFAREMFEFYREREGLFDEFARLGGTSYQSIRAPEDFDERLDVLRRAVEHHDQEKVRVGEAIERFVDTFDREGRLEEGVDRRQLERYFLSDTSEKRRLATRGIATGAIDQMTFLRDHYGDWAVDPVGRVMFMDPEVMRSYNETAAAMREAMMEMRHLGMTP